MPCVRQGTSRGFPTVASVRIYGYVISSNVAFCFADRDETREEGDAFHVPRTHSRHLAGTDIVQFSPTDEAAKTSDVVRRNMTASQ